MTRTEGARDTQTTSFLFQFTLRGKTVLQLVNIKEHIVEVAKQGELKAQILAHYSVHCDVGKLYKKKDVICNFSVTLL